MDILIPIFLFVAGIGISYVVIKTAVSRALLSHYKTVRLYEATGEWQPGPHDSKEPRKL